MQGLSLRDIALSVLKKKGKTIITHQMDMVFTHFGISGPAVLRCSQFVVKEQLKGQASVHMVLDTLPNISKDTLIKKILTKKEDQPRKSIKNIIKEITDIPERFIQLILDMNGIDVESKAGNTSKETVFILVQSLKEFTFSVNGSLPIEKAFVTGGGVSTKEIIPNTMESKRTDRVFFCGEILDIHGYTGGYNITAALVTGRLAGTNAAYASMAL